MPIYSLRTRPLVEIGGINFGSPGQVSLLPATHTAHVKLTNPTDWSWNYSCKLWFPAAGTSSDWTGLKTCDPHASVTYDIDVDMSDFPAGVQDVTIDVHCEEVGKAILVDYKIGEIEVTVPEVTPALTWD